MKPAAVVIGFTARRVLDALAAIGRQLGERILSC